MRVMTFNIRFENDRDGENGWNYRKDFLIDVILSHRPSVLGTQEGTARQLRYLKERLTGYRMYAPERPDDDTGQYPTLFYDGAAFQVKEGGEFWLSKTPGIYRSKDWDSAFPRMMSYALLEDVRQDRSLWVAVTHLDHLGVEARREQAGIIAEWARGLTGPSILMGDFNDRPESPVHRVLTAPETGWQDTWQRLAKGEGEESMTHHGFRGIPQLCRMDWILVSPHFEVLNACIIRSHCNGRYPSDHFPYAVDLAWA